MKISTPLLSALCVLVALPASAAPKTATAPPTKDTAVASPVESTRSPRTVALTIAGPDDDPELVVGLEIEVTQWLQARDVVVDPESETGIFLVIAVDPGAPDVHQVDVRLEVGSTTDFLGASNCTRCGSANLVDHIATRLAAALETLPDEASQARAEKIPPATVVVDNDPPPDDVPPTVSTSGQRFGTRGIIGATLLGAGVAAVGAGAGLYVREVTEHPSRASWELRLRPPGIAMMAVGGATAVAGAVLLGLQLSGKRKRHVVTPVVGSKLTGLMLRGRF